MREVYPHLPLFEQQGLGIALLSYCGRLHVGMAADWNLAAFLHDLVERLDGALAELADAAGLPAEETARGNGHAPDALVPLQVVAAPA
jgi:hypothetical protein